MPVNGDGSQLPEPFSQRHVQADDCGKKYGDGFHLLNRFRNDTSAQHVQDVFPRVVDGGHKADDCGREYGDGFQPPEPIRNDTSKMFPQEWSMAVA